MSASEGSGERIRAIAGALLSRLVPDVALGRPVIADEKTLTSARGSTLAYYDRGAKAGGRRPLVLLHSVNACASSYELRPLFEHYRAVRPTYALDLPGFGLSDRDDRPYTIARYVDAVRDLLAWVEERDGEADVVALSLSGEFAAHVAVNDGDAIHSLALVSPTGFETRASRRTSLAPMLKALRRDPVASRLLFDAVASHRSISYFLRKTFVGEPDPGLLAYCHATAHRPGAQYAPFDFLAGDLFTPDVREEVYARVTVPSLVVYDVDPFVKFDALPDFVARHPVWKAERLAPSRGMPQFERLPALTRTLDAFWHDADSPRSPAA